MTWYEKHRDVSTLLEAERGKSAQLEKRLEDQEDRIKRRIAEVAPQFAEIKSRKPSFPTDQCASRGELLKLISVIEEIGEVVGYGDEE